MMKKADSFRMSLLVFFAGIAAGVWTPQSWYPGGTMLPNHVARLAHVALMALVR